MRERAKEREIVCMPYQYLFMGAALERALQIIYIHSERELPGALVFSKTKVGRATNARAKDLV